MRQIFVVDDEKNIRELIKKYLEKEGYGVTLFSNGLNVLESVRSMNPDLIVMDIMMPGLDGLELCKMIRKESEVPIIFVSARDDEFDRIIGIEIGGDDYLTKPFSPRELTVRIKNIFKRLGKTETLVSNSKVIKDLSIDYGKRSITKDSVPIKLTNKEYELFEFFIRNINIPFTREALIEKVWGYDYVGELRVIDDLVKRLRKKLKDLGSEVTIETVWGYGYKVED